MPKGTGAVIAFIISTVVCLGSIRQNPTGIEIGIAFLAGIGVLVFGSRVIKSLF